MKASIGRIGVFAAAIGAQCESAHAGPRAVIGEGARYRIARPAMGAGDEGMAPAAPCRIEQLGEAVGANGRVRADRGRAARADALHDPESVQSFRCNRVRDDRVDARARRSIAAQPLDERGQLRLRSLGGDLDAARIIAYPPGEFEIARETPDKRPEADALDDAADANVLRGVHQMPCAKTLAWRSLSIQASHSGMPAPVFAEIWITGRPGLTRCAHSIAKPTSNSRYGSRSHLLSSSSDAARNMSGYFSGLSSPSVTDHTTTLWASPRSNAAGQTRLPTFSMSRRLPGRNGSSAMAWPTAWASRWQPLPVLICSAGAPVARMRSASRAVS